MRNLYFKIFLWFWLAMALVGVAFVVSTVTLQNSEADSRWRSFVASGLSLSGQSAIDAYQSRGREGLAAFLERMEQRNDIRAYLYDEQLQELSSRQAPAAGVALVASAITSDDLAVEEFEDSRLLALSLMSPEGKTFVLLADMEWPFRGGGRSRDGRGGRGAETGARPSTGEAPGSSTSGGGRDNVTRRGDRGGAGCHGAALRVGHTRGPGGNPSPHHPLPDHGTGGGCLRRPQRPGV